MQISESIIKASVRMIASLPEEKILDEAGTLLRLNKSDSYFVNSMKCLFAGVNDPISDIKSRKDKVLKHIVESNRSIMYHGYRKIKHGMNVFAPFYSNNIISILKYSNKKGKKFSVHTIEGKHIETSKQYLEALSKEELNVYLHHDLNVYDATKSADICLLPAIALMKKGVLALSGSKNIVNAAMADHVPVYFCTNSWRFSPKNIEIKPPFNKGPYPSNIRPIPGKPELIKDATGIICELGILKHNHLIGELKSHYKWMFSEFS